MSGRPLLGRKDAWALAGIGAGVAAASPLLAGHPLALAGLAPVVGGAAWLAYQRARQRLNLVDPDKQEDFILASDETFGEIAPSQKGLRFGYTRDNELPVDIEDKYLTRHFAIIGQSGVGKTTFGEFLLWQQTLRGGGWIFIDAKLDAETRDKLGLMMRLAGRADDFHVLNVDDPDNSNTYNPILKGDADEVASRLLNLLPSSENSPGADYFRQSANHALTVLTAAMKAAGYRYTFADMSILLQSAAAMGELARYPMPAEAKMPLEVFLDQFTGRTKAGPEIDVKRVKEVLGGMAGRIALFAQGKFGRVFNTYAPEIDLTDIVRNNKCLYVMLPTMGKADAALSLGKMILSDLRTAVYNVQSLRPELRPNPPFMVFADEMGSYVMPSISRLFEQARSANIMMVPAFQTFANLSTVSKDFADMIIGNTWSKVFFKFASKDSPEVAAEIIGKTRKYVYSLSTSENEGSSASNVRTTPQGSASKGGGMSQSWRESEEYRVNPEHLKRMGMGEVCIISGSRLFHAKTPMLNFPKPVPEYKVARRPTFVPPDEKCMNLQDRYRQFLVAATAEARDHASRGD